MTAMAEFWSKLPPTTKPDIGGEDDSPGDVVALKTPAPKKPKEKPKVYVHIQGVGVSETFDDKYKDTLPPIMNAALASAVDASPKLTTTENPEGFYLDGNLALKRTSDGVSASLHMQMADWPKKSMFAFPSGKVGVEVPNPKRIDGDVEAAVSALIAKILLSVIPEFERRAP